MYPATSSPSSGSRQHEAQQIRTDPMIALRPRHGWIICVAIVASLMAASFALGWWWAA